MKAGTTGKLKFKKLQRRLSESLRGTVGLLETLWLGVASNCPRGDIGRFSNEEIAIIADWEHDPDALVDALVATAWLDEDPEYRLVVHDWEDHCPNYVKGNVVQHMNGFIRSPGDGPQGTLPKGEPPEPPPTSLTKPIQAYSSQAKDMSRSRTNTTAISSIVQHYQTKHPRAKPGAKDRKLIADRLKEGYSAEELRQAIDGCHNDPFHCGENEQRKKYQSLNLIMRDSAHVAKFIECANGEDVKPRWQPPEVTT